MRFERRRRRSVPIVSSPIERETALYDLTNDPSETADRIGDPAAAAARRRRTPPGPQTVPLDEGQGTARVIATFSAAGEYLMRARVDNFGATDSGDGDQCCWTNGYIRVTVTP